MAPTAANGAPQPASSRPTVSWSAETTRKVAGPVAFAIGVITALGVQAWVVLAPILRRSAPVETDDAYIYIIRGPQMTSCFLQDCAALNDLRGQLLAPSSDPRVAWIRCREYGRAFTVYHPLHTLLMAAAHACGLSWEASFSVLAVAGGVVLVAGIAAWLAAAWGMGPAGIALVLFAFNVGYPGHRLEWVVPSTWALALAMWTWAALARWPTAAHWAVPGGTVALVAMHPVGVLYAMVTLAAWALLAERPLSRRAWVCVAIGMAVVGVRCLLPSVVSRPELSMPELPRLEGWSFQRGLLGNLAAAWRMVAGWSGFFGGSVVVGLLALVAACTVAARRRRVVLVMGGLLALLAVGSLFHTLPYGPGELFRRNWYPLAVVLTGAVGYAAWRWSAWVLGSLCGPRRREPARPAAGRWRRLAVVVAAGLLAGYVGLCCVLGCVAGFRALSKKVRVRAARWALRLDPEQPAVLLSRIRAGESVLYMHEVPMHFCFAHGGLDYGAVYYPALRGTPDEKTWVQDHTSIRYVVACSPVEGPPTECRARPSDAGPIAYARMLTKIGEYRGRGGALPLAPGAQLAVESRAQRPLSSMRIYVENPGGDAVLAVRPAGGDGAAGDGGLELAVPSRWAGWLPLGARDDVVVGGFVVESGGWGGRVRVGGLRVGPGSSLRWPWDQGITLSYRASRGREWESIRFVSAALAPCLRRELRVLHDRGSTVLAEVCQ